MKLDCGVWLLGRPQGAHAAREVLAGAVPSGKQGPLRRLQPVAHPLRAYCGDNNRPPRLGDAFGELARVDENCRAHDRV